MDNIEVTLSSNNEKLIKAFKEIVYEYKLDWNFESIYFVLDTCEQTYDDLQILGPKHAGLRTLLLAGLPEEKRDKKTVMEIMERFRKEAGASPKRFHALLIEHLETKHFFMDTQEMEEMANLTAMMEEKIIASQQMISELFIKSSILEKLKEGLEKSSKTQ